MEELQLSCAEIRRELSNYFENEISQELRLRIDQHVMECKGCRALYDGVRNVIQLVGREAVIELPPGLSQRLYQRMRPN